VVKSLARPGSTSNDRQRFGFGKDLRIRSRRDFVRIQKGGRKTHSANFVVLSTAQSPPRASSRFGFSVSRRVGDAVERNRLKRRLRELCRLHRREFAAARDFVLIAKPGAAELSYEDLVRELHAPLST
jgi:ribonuclease P protein component